MSDAWLVSFTCLGSVQWEPNAFVGSKSPWFQDFELFLIPSLLVPSRTFQTPLPMPHLLHSRIVNSARRPQDTVDMPIMIDPFRRLAQPIRLLAPRDPGEETLMKLCVSNAGKVSTCFDLVSVLL